MKLFSTLLCTLALIGLTACQSTSTRAPSPADPALALSAHKWELVQLNGQALAGAQNGNTPHLIFLAAEQRIAGSTGCNRIMGSYTLADDGSIQLGQMATTRMACPNMATEAAFLAALRNYDSSQLTGDTLSLLNAANEPLASFVAKPLPE